MSRPFIVCYHMEFIRCRKGTEELAEYNVETVIKELILQEILRKCLDY